MGGKARSQTIFRRCHHRKTMHWQTRAGGEWGCQEPCFLYHGFIVGEQCPATACGDNFVAVER